LRIFARYASIVTSDLVLWRRTNDDKPGRQIAGEEEEE
jgi:hypothetical protein